MTRFIFTHHPHHRSWTVGETLLEKEASANTRSVNYLKPSPQRTTETGHRIQRQGGSSDIKKGAANSNSRRRHR